MVPAKPVFFRFDLFFFHGANLAEWLAGGAGVPPGSSSRTLRIAEVSQRPLSGLPVDSQWARAVARLTHPRFRYLLQTR